MLKGVLRYILFPISLLYGLTIRIRNQLFNAGIIATHSFKVPIISIGNLAVGGTGKTPHIEYLIKLLSPSLKVATLSRGYKRSTFGYLLALKHHTASDIGDEPAQIKKKFPSIIVAVDTNRVKGARQILSANPDTDLILLDDAYQHRKITPSLNILLTDYSKPYFCDYLMPSGRLREHRANSKRADIIIITRSPINMTNDDKSKINSKIKLQAHQSLFYSSVVYKEPISLFEDTLEPLCLNKIIESQRSILLITGIAHPEHIYKYLSVFSKNIIQIKYPDHHNFTQRDINHIASEYSKLPANNRCVITTEKDAERLKEIDNLASYFDRNIYLLPIGINFQNNNSNDFNNLIKLYVKQTKSNSSIS